MAIVNTKKGPDVPTVSFGAEDFFSGNQFLSDGPYIAIDHSWVYDKGMKGNAAEAGLSLQIAFTSLRDGAEYSQRYGAGKKASSLFRPHPNNAKQLAKVPGTDGKASDNSKLAIYLQHLRNAGLPPGVLDNDLSVLDGVRVQIINIDPPSDWSDLGNNANKSAKLAGGQQAPAAPAARKFPIPVVDLVFDGGMPWQDDYMSDEDFTLPGEEATTAKNPTPKAPVRTAAGKTNGKAPAPAPAAEEELDDEALVDAGLKLVLEDAEYAAGVATTIFQAEGFKRTSATFGDDAGQRFMELIKDKESLKAMLGQIGYQIKGLKIVKV